MKRSLFAPFAVFSLASAILLGCGGGGGGGTSGSDGGSSGGRPAGAITTQQIVGVSSGKIRSLGNLAVGDKVNIRSLALYFSQNRYTGGYLETTSDIFVDAPGVATLDGSTLTAVGQGTGTISLVGANGVALGPVAISVEPVGTRISGRVRRVQVNNSSAGIAGVVVKFLNSSGTTVAQVPTGPDGSYQANVPTSATSFIVDLAALPTTFYNQFTYGDLDYTAEPGDSGLCSVPLPALSEGASITLDDAIGYARSSSSPPAPPVSGCQQ